ncbi:MAG: S8 family serine peptidase [Candidatus Eisenbacteria bacterium]|nr:S8 family serine peptidase [Candidatus Eisenbacteria bacterium]
MFSLSSRAALGSAFLVLLLSPVLSDSSLEDSVPLLPRLAEPEDGASVRAEDAMLRWEGVPGAEIYHVFVSPRPFAPPSDLSSIEEDWVHVTAERNWVHAARLGLPKVESERWFWTAAIERGGVFLAPAPRSFRLFEPDASLDATAPIQRIGTRKKEQGARRGAVVFSNGERATGTAPKALASTAERHWIVRFEGPIREEWKKAIEREGRRAAGYLPDDALIVRASPEGAEKILASPGVDWVAPYEGRFKIEASLASRAAGEERVVALLFPGESAEWTADSLARAGFDILDRSTNAIVLRAGGEGVRRLADFAEIRWIEPFREPVFFNQDCQWVVQTNTAGNRSIWARGLRGEGGLLSLCDSGLRAPHRMFHDALRTIAEYGDFPDHRKIVAYRKACDSPLIFFGDDPGAFYHGTHTACTLAGNDSTFGASGLDGIAPEARLFFVDAGGNSNIVHTPADLADLFLLVYEGNEAGAPRIMSNSWGALGGGAYDFRCEQLDRFVWEHKDFLLVFSNGNGAITNSVASPAASKNCVGAGGTENGSQANQIYSSTSRGPTDDGRIKPTLCAPARLASASGETDAAYQTLEGTSMAAPSIAASAALVRQYFMEGWYPSGVKGASASHPPSAALLRAMLVSGSVSDFAGHAIPSFDIGWGRIRLEDALAFSGDSKRLAITDESPGLLTGEIDVYRVTVASSAEPLKAVLVWTDYPSSPAASRNLVNDLDLTVRKGGLVYLGNVFSGGLSVAGGARDSLNVEECVLLAGPAAGEWTIEVAAAAVPFGPQPYALVVTGALDANVGSISLDRNSYGAIDTIFVRVEDGDAPSALVLLSSDTEVEPESLALAGSGGLFVGAFPTATGGPVHGDGLLSVSHGDSIRAEYQGRTAGAAAWLRGPVLRPPAASAPDDASAVIRWESDIPSDSRVAFGIDGFPLADTIVSRDLVLVHEVAIDGLLPDTTYRFSVSSADFRGNRTADDGGSALYRFTTGGRADILLVVGDATFEDSDRYRFALNRFGWLGRIAEGTIPPLGDRTRGLRSHPVVWWQAGWEEYPPFSDAARETIDRYLAGGGRLAAVSHDAVWALSDPASPFRSEETASWLGRCLKASFLREPSFWSIVFGAANDPISGSYSIGGISYTPIRGGGAGDVVARAAVPATIDSVWSENASQGMIGLRWIDASPSGHPDSAVWGGTKSRGATYCFEWSRLNTSNDDDFTRASVFDKTVRWLIGRDHPDVVLTTFASGGTINSSPVTIRWNETIHGGVGVGQRRIEWSGDGGASWNTIAANAGPSPCSWNLTGVPNGTTLRIRVLLADGGSPPLHGMDASDADIVLAIPGNDTRGPRIVAGSARVAPDPVPWGSAAEIRAAVSDSLRGGSAVVAAAWSLAPDGSGEWTAMSGTWGSAAAEVFDTIDASLLAPPVDTIWIRGKDSGGMWGEASPLHVVLRGDFTGIEDAAPPLSFRLHPSAPNPFNPQATIRFDLPAAGAAHLSVYDVSGRLVRVLADGPFAAGSHETAWDGRDDRGRAVGSGVYLLSLESAGRRATARTVLLR